MQELTPLELAVQLMSDLSVPVHCTLSSQILPVPAPNLAPNNASVSISMHAINIDQSMHVLCPAYIATEDERGGRRTVRSYSSEAGLAKDEVGKGVQAERQEVGLYI